MVKANERGEILEGNLSCIMEEIVKRFTGISERKINGLNFSQFGLTKYGDWLALQRGCGIIIGSVYWSHISKIAASNTSFTFLYSTGNSWILDIKFISYLQQGIVNPITGLFETSTVGTICRISLRNKIHINKYFLRNKNKLECQWIRLKRLVMFNRTGSCINSISLYMLLLMRIDCCKN